MNGSDEQLAPTDILKHEHTVVLLGGRCHGS